MKEDATCGWNWQKIAEAAMHGAPEPVQRAARYLAPPSEADGAARMIERLILGLDGE